MNQEISWFESMRGNQTMKVGEHIEEGEVETAGCPCRKPVAVMLTYNRAGFLTGTVRSFFETTRREIPLLIFDDGSDSAGKHIELECVRAMDGAKVFEFSHAGFVEAWLKVFDYVKSSCGEFDSVITLEDDLIFAEGWAEVLVKMQTGIAKKGFRQGMVTCFRPHENPQSPVVDLNGVRAYQSMAHTWHVNMMPMDILRHMDVIHESAEEVRKSKSRLGLDVYLVGNLAHRLGRVSFLSEESWVAHVGVKDSIVAGQGYKSCTHRGVNLVKELEGFRMENCSVV